MQYDHKKIEKKWPASAKLRTGKQKEYDHSKIERKWQTVWEKQKTYQTLPSVKAKAKKMKPYYVLDMFPYPSGAGLHVGHPRGYIASDAFSRYKRMQGYNVLHPMGFDSFGLPAEQYAIQTGKHPGPFTDTLIKRYREQLSVIGFSYDWSREVATHHPEYYKFTQWIFLQIYNSYYNLKTDKAEPIEKLVKELAKNGNIKVSAVCDGDTPQFSAKEWKSFSEIEQQNILMKYRLAYEGNASVNWCEELGTVLANDEIVDGPNGPVSERGGHPVVKKKMRQWFMRITAYADRLIAGLDTINWSSHIKEIQRNWIGKSEGSQISFKLKAESGKEEYSVDIFTTRADTLFGATYMVLAPEHLLVESLKLQVSSEENRKEIEKYISQVKNTTEADRTDAKKEKTGVELKGVKAINPANGEEIPVWIADYVLAGYGTGAVMAVPAHDERDFEFAKKYNLPIKQVIESIRISDSGPDAVRLDQPIKVYKDAIWAIIKHWSEDKYLCIKWKNASWQNLITGGVEKRETVVDAARREVVEESGYTNIKSVIDLHQSVHSRFYHEVKGWNQQARFHSVYIELGGPERSSISDTENDLHDILWIDSKDVENFINVSNAKYAWRLAQGLESSCFVNDGILVASDNFSGLLSEEARAKITKFVGGKIVTKYKMRDAIFARQRYWGEPIPLLHSKDGIVTSLKENKLPLKLPNVKSYTPSGTGESPLAGVKDWVKAGYETNTMPGWAGSSWYFLRYIDPKNKKEFASVKELDYWFGKNGGVDMYVGGSEHATGHLLYSRFWHKILKDLGYIKTEEPFKTLRNQGLIMAHDGRKMSKRWGNVVNPDDIVKTYGADTLRLYEMFIGPFDQTVAWSTEAIIGPRKFLERVWRLAEKVQNQNSKTSDKNAEKIIHRTVKKVTEDIEAMNFNTAVSSMMICLNEMEKSQAVAVSDFKMFLQILAPFAPHIADELWGKTGEKKSLHLSIWPKYNPKLLVDNDMKIMIQVGGKVRAELIVPIDSTEEYIKSQALLHEKVIGWIDGKDIKKVIYVKNKLLSIVVS